MHVGLDKMSFHPSIMMMFRHVATVCDVSNSDKQVEMLKILEQKTSFEWEACGQVDGIAPFHIKEMPVSWVHKEQPEDILIHIYLC